MSPSTRMIGFRYAWLLLALAGLPDGSRVYVSNESDSMLDVVDRRSGKVVKKVPLSGHPNNISVTKDGGRVLELI